MNSVNLVEFVFLNRFSGSRAILSGPAGGVVGYAMTTYKKESDLPVIGFDMGGNIMSFLSVSISCFKIIIYRYY